MEGSIRRATVLLGLIGSVLASVQLGFLALLILVIIPEGEHVNNYQVPALQQELLAAYLLVTLLAFSGSVVSYSRPRMGGTILLVAGVAPIAFELFFIIQEGGRVVLSPLLVIELAWLGSLLTAGVLALVKRNSWPTPPQNQTSSNKGMRAKPNGGQTAELG